MVSEKTIKSLSFDKVLHSVGALCIAEDSAKMLLERYPLTSVDKVLQEHAKYKAIAHAAENSKVLPKVLNIPACIDLFNAPQSKIYTINELATLRNALDTMHRCAQWVDDTLSFDDPFRIKFSSSLVPSSFLKTLLKFFDEQGKIRTDNIPELRDLERKRLRIQKNRNKIAQEFLHNNSDICASSTPTLRDERIVLPIRSSHKSRIVGIVHASSAREKSVYIEIPALYELNNASLQLREEEHALYYKLCLSLSEQLTKISQKLNFCYEAFMVFDSLYARYKYGKMNRGVLVAITPPHDPTLQSRKNTEEILEEFHYHIHLQNATNPFVVACSPLTFTFDSHMRQLVLTGPNAGGKTVALKTLGLCALMNQSAIPLPLGTDDASCCVLPVFENIDVVIGDAQNLEEGLSTFSSHLTAVKHAIQEVHATKSSLLLFDELCADTDDREGAALACALLEYLSKTNSTLCITTHSALVKHYVITKARSKACLAALTVTRDEANAAQGNTGAHSYCIRYNEIGTSEAIGVAKRIGMPPKVLENYEMFLRFFGDDYNSMLNALQNSYTKAEILREELTREKQNYAQALHDVHVKKQEFERQQKEGARVAFFSGTSLLSDMRLTFERVSEMLARMKKASSDETLLSRDELRDMIHRVRDERNVTKKFQDGLAELESTMQNNAQSDTHDSLELQEGDKVKILANDVQGTIISRSHDKRKYCVQAGVLTLTLLRDELQVITEHSENEKISRHGFSADIADISVPDFLDVRGCTTEEATEKLEAYIDAALLKNRKSFSIIHGKGTGILMRSMHRILKEHPLIAHAQYADESDGGAGKTYVYLK